MDDKYYLENLFPSDELPNIIFTNPSLLRDFLLQVLPNELHELAGVNPLFYQTIFGSKNAYFKQEYVSQWAKKGLYVRTLFNLKEFQKLYKELEYPDGPASGKYLATIRRLGGGDYYPSDEQMKEIFGIDLAKKIDELQTRAHAIWPDAEFIPKIRKLKKYHSDKNVKKFDKEHEITEELIAEMKKWLHNNQLTIDYFDQINKLIKDFEQKQK